MGTSWVAKLRKTIEGQPKECLVETPDAPDAEITEPVYTPRFPRAGRAKPPFIDWSRTRSPTAQAMIVDAHKLIYLPIAKNACSSTKRLVAQLGGLTLERGQDIHTALDQNNTGLQFKDHSADHIKHVLAAHDWMRFMVFRDPIDRLVSAYVEKFVINRERPEQWETCSHVIKTVFGIDTPTAEDYEHGVTFREFAEYILAHDPQQLDSHWQPQIFYMGHVPLTHLYDVKSLELLEADLRDHIRADIVLPRVNVSRDESDTHIYRKHAVDLLPQDLDDAKSLSLSSFLPQDLHSRLLEFYAADVSTYSLIKALSQSRLRHR